MKSQVCFFHVVIFTFLITSTSLADDLYIYSDAVVPDTGYYDTVYVHDTPPSNTTVEFYGQAEKLQTNDSSTFNIHEDGYFSGSLDNYIADLYDSSTVNVYSAGGFSYGSGGIIRVHDSATLNVLGGSVSAFTSLQNSSQANMYSGYIFSLGLYSSSVFNMYGGRVDTFMYNYSYSDPNITINIYGSDFTYTPYGELRELPGEQVWISKLTGTGLYGNSITYYGIPDPSIHPNIHLIPEPATLFFVGLGILGLRVKRTKR